MRPEFLRLLIDEEADGLTMRVYQLFQETMEEQDPPLNMESEESRRFYFAAVAQKFETFLSGLDPANRNEAQRIYTETLELLVSQPQPA